MVLSTLLSSNKDDVVITAASPMTSFDWSDFPLVHQFNPDDDVVDFGTSCSDSSCSFELHHNNKKTVLADTDGFYTSFTPFLSSSHSSLWSTASSDSSSCTSSSRERLVSFAPAVEVREYDLTIGANLSCDQLPLSLGWNYSEATYKDYSCPSSQRRGNQLKLTLQERRNLLKQVGGFTEEELRQQTNTIHHVKTCNKLAMESDL